MNKLFTFLAAVIFSLNSYALPTQPTIVLVHGALLTSSVWAPVQSALQNHGYNVITIDTPGRVADGVAQNNANLTAATAKICKVLKLQSNPVMLAGHSQAGAIITQATNSCPEKIAGLVYVAAVAPLPDEKAFDLLSASDNKNFDSAAPLDEKKGLAIPNLRSDVKNLFIGNDIADKDAELAVINMVPEPIALGDEKLKYNVTEFSRIPKFYIQTVQDRIISFETQKKYIKRQYFNKVYQLQTGHSPFVTQPAKLATILIQINNQLTAS